MIVCIPLQRAELLTLSSALTAIVVENVELFHEVVAKLCLDLTNTLQIEVNANLYLTPSTVASRSFPWHSDLTDIFVLQLDGVKHWEAFFSPVFLTTHVPYQSELTSQWSLTADAENQTFLTATLNPGSVLYLPANWIHKATALQPEPSKRPVGQNTDRVTSSTGSLHLTITPKTQQYRIDVLLDNVLEVLPTYMQVGLFYSSCVA